MLEQEVTLRLIAIGSWNAAVLIRIIFFADSVKGRQAEQYLKNLENKDFVRPCMHRFECVMHSAALKRASAELSPLVLVCVLQIRASLC